jgi:hypothetical protein
MITPEAPAAVPADEPVASPIPAITRPTRPIRPAAPPKAAPPPAPQSRRPDLNDPARPLHPRRIWPD